MSFKAFSIRFFLVFLILLFKFGSETCRGEELPSYETFTEDIKNVRDTMLADYPKWMYKEPYREDPYVIFPPPKGSRILRHSANNNSLAMVTDVYVNIMIEGFVRMTVEEHSLTIMVKETFFWNDESLTSGNLTSADDSRNIRQVEIEADRIWTPTLYARNVFDYHVMKEPKFVRVSPRRSRGGSDAAEFDCVLARQTMYSIPCSVSVRNFPFDTHNCSLVLTQPPNENYRMQLHKKKQKHSKDNTEKFHNMDYTILDWFLTDSKGYVQAKELSYNGQPLTVDEFYMTIHLKRCSIFYSIVLILPCLLLNAISLAIFTLPIKDTERENFAMNLLLTYFVFILLVVESSPPSGETIPLLGLYTILSTSVLMLTYGMSLLLIELHEHKRQKNRRMSAFLLRLINNKLCLYLFTNKETYGCLYRSKRPVTSSLTSEADDRTDGNVLARLESVPAVSIADIKYEVQWKILCKFLNFIFFCVTLVAHVAIIILILVHV